MAEHSAIEWTDATWNPITGCSVISPGCTNCYAMKLAGTRLRHHWSRKGLTIESKSGPVWTGEVRLNSEWLDQPLRWRRPRRIFVVAHGDLFHPKVPRSWIVRVFAVMALARHHIFQVLTKRTARMRGLLSDPAFWIDIDKEVDRIAPAHRHDRELQDASGESWPPLPNVWLGASAEDQPRADARIPDLLSTAAALHFLSYEPALGPVDLTCIPNPLFGGARASALKMASPFAKSMSWPVRLDWVIAGGESGPNARPMHPDWARSVRDQCQAAGVPFFFKQWGEWRPGWVPENVGIVEMRGATGNSVYWPDGTIGPGHADERGGIGQQLERVGKEKAGRVLDGRLWDEQPQRRER